MKLLALPAILMSAFAILVAAPLNALAFPNYSGVVSDEARVIDPNDEAILGLRLLDYEGLTNIRFLVHTTNGLGEQKIEDYGRELLAHWHMNAANDPATVLLILSPSAGKVRWQLNPKAKPLFTVEKQDRILREVMLPYFSKADFSAGLSRGLDAAANVLADRAAMPASDSLLPGFAKTTSGAEASLTNNLAQFTLARWEWLLIVLLGLSLALLGFAIPSLSNSLVNRRRQAEKSDLRPVGFGGRLASTSW